jgi:rod shape determining protein RodA
VIARLFRGMDWYLLVLTLIICCLGVLQIFSATEGTKWQDAWWKQVVFVGGGLLLMWVVSQVDYHSLVARVFPLYAGILAMLVLTMVVGSRVFGSTRWIKVAGFTLQVSEFAKIVIVLLVARYFSDLRPGYELEWKDLAKIGGLVAIPMLLVMKQPDLGTALTFIPILICGILTAGMRWNYLLIIAAILLISLPIGYHFLKPYQKDRLASFVDPERDPRGTGFQVIQSRIAVGNGGMWGRGVTQGSQTHLGFLPVPHTDFIFSSFAEEHGFVGVVVALVLYFLFILQIIQNAQTAGDREGVFICLGIGALMLFHVLVNVAMVVGRMPVTGIPLPLMSSGGSNILSVFLMLGLVNSVRLRRLVS